MQKASAIATYALGYQGRPAAEMSIAFLAPAAASLIAAGTVIAAAIPPAIIISMAMTRVAITIPITAVVMATAITVATVPGMSDLGRLELVLLESRRFAGQRIGVR